ncbi:MAG: NIL domain-containing protein, partial [Nodosilinea sp.]
SPSRCAMLIGHFLFGCKDYCPCTLFFTLVPQPLDTPQIQVRLRIPKTYHGEPIISNLTSRYGLQVNIVAALLGADGGEDGWFDLVIDGEASLIRQALIDLVQLEADIWVGSEQEDYT